VAEFGTSKSGGTISQLGCSSSVACHGSPIKQQQPPVPKEAASWSSNPDPVSKRITLDISLSGTTPGNSTLPGIQNPDDAHHFPFLVLVLYTTYPAATSLLPRSRYCLNYVGHLRRNLSHRDSTYQVTYLLDGFGGLMFCVLASGSRVRGFEPGRSRWIFSV
jgi:hypothetical protein